MDNVCHDIFRAIHEGKWLNIEYQNREGQVTKYWIGIRGLDPVKGTLSVDGLHLGRYTTETFERIYISSILSTQIVEGSYCPVNEALVQDISLNPHRYKPLFEHVANLKILNYLEMCNAMDAVPYHSDFALVHQLDNDSFQGESYALSEKQFRTIVKNFQLKMEKDARQEGRLKLQQLAMNVLSIHTVRGLYVLACRKLRLDVKDRVLRPEEDLTICTEYRYGEEKESIRRYLDADEYELLKNFEKNQEKIKNCVTRHVKQVMGVDDMPYVIGMGMDISLDLHREYRAIIKMYNQGEATVPLKAFFGDLLSRPVRRKDYPIMLVNRKINLDQLLAINNGMKYPVAYIQGPPGTGKTNTIINTIITAFFNGRTVLFASYNNHPISAVFEKLKQMEYRGERIPFPVLRLGNADKVREALQYIKEVYEQVKTVKIFESTLERNKDDRARRAKKLSALLKKYEEVLDLKERRETLQRLLEYQDHGRISLEMIPFQADLASTKEFEVNETRDGYTIRKLFVSPYQVVSYVDAPVTYINKKITRTDYEQKLGLAQGEEASDMSYEDYVAMQTTKRQECETVICNQAGELLAFGDMAVSTGKTTFAVDGKSLTTLYIYVFTDYEDYQLPNGTIDMDTAAHKAVVTAVVDIQ